MSSPPTPQSPSPPTPTPDGAVGAQYDKLRAMARRLLGPNTGGQPLDATDVVHESFLRLSKLDGFRYLGEASFLSLAAMTLRSVLVDLARERATDKRGRDWRRVTLREVEPVTTGRELDLLALNEALETLARLHARQARVVELRFFGGLSREEIAEVLQVTGRTVSQDWTMARAWLRSRLEGEPQPRV